MSHLSGGFSDAAVQSSQAFRALLEVMARPGRIETLTGAVPPAPLSVAAGVALLTLTDPTTPVHLAGEADCAAVRDWITFHTGAPLVAAEAAHFALGTWEALQPITRFALGEPAYPDRSATLIIERTELKPQGHRLTGPGIQHEAFLNLPEAQAFQDNAKLFPLGFDLLLTAGDRIAALPRTTKVEDI